MQLSVLDSMPSQPTKASQCRRNAYYCQMLATDAASEADRAALITMRQAWLALADNEEWLAGSSEPNGHDHTGRFSRWPDQHAPRKNPTWCPPSPA